MAASIIDFGGPMQMAYQAALLTPRLGQQESLADYREGQLGLERAKTLYDIQEKQRIRGQESTLSSIYAKEARGETLTPEEVGVKTVTAPRLGVTKPFDVQSPLEEAKTRALDQQAFDLTTQTETQKIVLAPMDNLLPATDAWVRITDEGQDKLNANGYDVQAAIWRTLKSEGKTDEAAQALGKIKGIEESYIKEEGSKQSVVQNVQQVANGLNQASQSIEALMGRNEQELDALVKVQEAGKIGQLYPDLTPVQANRKASFIVSAMTEQRDLLQGMKELTGMQTEYIRNVRLLDPDERADRLARIHTKQSEMQGQRDAIEKRIEGLQGEKATIQQRRFSLQSAKFDAAQQYKQNLAAAQAELVAGSELTPRAAGPIAKRHGVTVSDVMDAAKDVNKPMVGIDFGKEVPDIVKESRASAMGAIETVDAANRISKAIQSGNVTLGPGATIRNSINQFAQLVGVSGESTTERLVNTRNAIRGLAQFAISARKSLKGQGQVSDFEGKLMLRAEAGEINDFTLPELKSFLSVTNRLARRQYEQHQGLLKTMRSNQKYANDLPFYEVPGMPDEVAGDALSKVDELLKKY